VHRANQLLWSAGHKGYPVPEGVALAVLEMRHALENRSWPQPQLEAAFFDSYRILESVNYSLRMAKQFKDFFVILCCVLLAQIYYAASSAFYLRVSTIEQEIQTLNERAKNASEDKQYLDERMEYKANELAFVQKWYPIGTRFLQ
jgi:hypothetical protein